MHYDILSSGHTNVNHFTIKNYSKKDESVEFTVPNDKVVLTASEGHQCIVNPFSHCVADMHRSLTVNQRRNSTKFTNF